MKTTELISLLAADTLPVARNATRRRLAVALLAGLSMALAILLTAYGVRDDLAQMTGLAMFWFKLAVPVTVAIAGFVVLQTLARPGVKLGARWVGLLLPVAMLWMLGFYRYGTAPVDERAALVWGTTWQFCLASIALMSLPVFIAAFVALRTLAPTRPVLAGACAGAMSGGVGAAVYALHCPEMAAPFLAIWYVGGMTIPTVAGALMGPRLLRW